MDEGTRALMSAQLRRQQVVEALERVQARLEGGVFEALARGERPAYGGWEAGSGAGAVFGLGSLVVLDGVVVSW